MFFFFCYILKILNSPYYQILIFTWLSCYKFTKWIYCYSISFCFNYLYRTNLINIPYTNKRICATRCKMNTIRTPCYISNTLLMSFKSFLTFPIFNCHIWCFIFYFSSFLFFSKHITIIILSFRFFKGSFFINLTK